MTEPAHARHPAELRALVRVLLRWFGHNARNLPWRRTRDPYAIWIAEVMLQQPRVSTVQSYWERWMRELPDLPSLARAHPRRLRKLWEGLGYYRRLDHPRSAARLILEQHAGRFPHTYDEILKLPGIGPYTAGAIASAAFNLPTPVVDGNVARVLSRFRGRPLTARSADSWALATRLVQIAARCMPVALLPLAEPGRPGTAPLCPPCSALNQALMELGATICLPHNPRCTDCPLRSRCLHARQGGADPGRATRRSPAEPRRLVACLVRSHGHWLLHQRSTGVNRGYWELPVFELPSDRPPSGHFPTDPESWFEFEPSPTQGPPTIVHHITRFRYHVEIRAARLKRPWPPGHWLTPRQLQNRPLSRLTTKILHHWTSTAGATAKHPEHDPAPHKRHASEGPTLLK